VTTTVIASLSPGRKHLVRALVVVVAALAVFAAPASAAPAPCWKTLMTEWYGGSIKHIYPIHCYHDALGHLPRDVQNYSSARDDILRALQQAIAAQKNGGGTTTNTTGATTPTTTTTSTTPTKHKRSPISTALRDITPGGPDSFPLPLLILGMLALLLVAAGVAGMIWRRYQGRGGTAA
jgi:hypothetical protein